MTLVASYVPILMYHSVSKSASVRFSPYVVHPELFRKHLDYLVEKRYSSITVGELIAARRRGECLPSRCVVLTFDDAFDDFYSEVLPQLLVRDLRATLFVPTAYVGGTAKWLERCHEGDRLLVSWSALSDISRSQIELAAHSRTHPEMDRLSFNDAVDEACGARHELEDHVGVNVGGFAYPFGYWSRTVRQAVQMAGFDYACQVAERTSIDADDVLAIPRHSVGRDTTIGSLDQLLLSQPAASSRLVSDAKRVLCRVARVVSQDTLPAPRRNSR